MSDTPRTDEWERHTKERGDVPTWDGRFAHMAHYARHLERELIELQHQHGIVKAILAKVEDERNELLQKAEDLRQRVRDLKRKDW